MNLHVYTPLFRPARGLACCAALAALAWPALGQSDEDTVHLQAVTVTGSNIRGVDTEKTLPVTVVTAEEITDIGIGSMAELVESMPFSTNVTINEGSTGPNDARGDVSTINLRNLGAGRTLVLLNGRRLSAYGVTPGTPPVQFVNINAIPLGAVEQWEVLRDGASAIYGSDAMGGVVNTILRQRYDGFETSLRYAFGDPSPRELTFNLAGGRNFNGGRSNLALFFNHYERRGLMARDRAYAADADKRLLVGAPFNTNSSFNNRNSSSSAGRFTAVNDSGTAVSVPGVTSATGQFYYDPTTGARAAGAGPTAFYNSQAGTQLLPDIQRANLFGTFDHRFDNQITLFSELSYYDSHSKGGFDSSPVSLGTDGVYIPKTNYYNPVGTRFYGPGTANPEGTPRDVAIRNYRLIELGPRSYDTWSESYRLLAGLRGNIASSSWSWESAALYMRGRTYQENHGYISQSRFLEQLALSTPDAYNPFGGENPESVWRNFVIDIWDEGIGSLTTLDAKASGTVFELPGGPVALAAGAEFRREAMKQRNDPFGLADDVIAQSEQLDVNASRDVYAGFAELNIPLIGPDNHVPLVRSLELRAAARYEEYERFSATKPGVGLSWRPTSWLLLRGSYNEGFRAPTVVELYTPAIGRRNEGITDTARAGQPDAISSISKRIVTGGNPDLRPEESRSYNLGAVLDVPFVRGLSFGADWYRIKQFDQIDNSLASDELTLDAQLWQQGGGSNPRVIREPRTASDIANNLPGVLIEVLSTYQNLSLRTVEGADFFANYRGPRTSWGRFTFTGTLTYLSKLENIDQAGNASRQIRNNGNPRVRSTFGVSWRHNNWSASIYERFTSDYNAPAAYTTNGQPFIIEEYWVTNASVGYTFRRTGGSTLRVRVGVNNVFDEDPPFYPNSSSGYHAAYADPRGRMPYLDVSLRF